MLHSVEIAEIYYYVSHHLVRKKSVKSMHLALYYYFMWFHEIFLGESKFLVFSQRCQWNTP